MISYGEIIQESLWALKVYYKMLRYHKFDGDKAFEDTLENTVTDAQFSLGTKKKNKWRDEENIKTNDATNEETDSISHSRFFFFFFFFFF